MTVGDYALAAEYYDLLYSEIKDYEAEVSRLLEIFGSATIPVHTVLDVACGSGRHAKILAQSGLRVDGLDFEPAFVRMAQERNPAGCFVVGDMMSFEVSEPYDAVLCLFGSIGYAADETELRAALGSFANALHSGGLLVLEPWFAPGDMEDGYVTALTAKRDELAVSRVSRTKIVGTVSRLEFEYLVARPAGIQHLSEVHELGLFPRSTMESVLAAAGFDVTYDPEGLIGRGLYVGTKL